MKVKGPAFEVKEYVFSQGSTHIFKTRAQLYDKYRDNRETSLNESLNLYAHVRKISSKDVSLVTIKDHSYNTLNFAAATKSRVA